MATKKKAATKKVTKKASSKAKAPKKKVAPVPPSHGTVSPHMIVSPCGEAIELYKKAFGAKALYSMRGPGDLVMHAEIKIGDSIVMLSDEQPPMPGRPQNRKTPANLGGTAAALMLYVKDVDQWFERAVAAGCTAVMPPADMFWGDRYSQVEDPFGHVWAIATRIKNMTPKQMTAAMVAAFSQPQS